MSLSLSSVPQFQACNRSQLAQPKFHGASKADAPATSTPVNLFSAEGLNKMMAEKDAYQVERENVKIDSKTGRAIIGDFKATANKPGTTFREVAYSISRFCLRTKETLNVTTADGISRAFCKIKIGRVTTDPAKQSDDEKLFAAANKLMVSYPAWTKS